jgi:hypothetical protein
MNWISSGLGFLVTRRALPGVFLLLAALARPVSASDGTAAAADRPGGNPVLESFGVSTRDLPADYSS